MNNEFLYFAKTRGSAIIPTKRIEDSGYDLYPCFNDESIFFNPGDIRLIPTGIAVAFAKEYVLFVKERSSTGSIGLSTRMGVIDSGYRGEIVVALNNTNNIPISIERNITQVIKNDALVRFPYTKAIAQAVLCKIPLLEAKEISYNELLSISSERGVSLLGASGK
jgi:dUTP pyrophosphatase